MRIDSSNSGIPAAAPAKMAHASAVQQSAPAAPPAPNPADLSVFVEIQKGNKLVFRFVNPATGQVIQQIPSEQVLRLSEAIAAFLQNAAKAGLK